MEIRLNAEVSLAEAEELILAIGSTNAVHLVGQPGVGKTAMASRLAKRTGFRLVILAYQCLTARVRPPCSIPTNTGASTLVSHW